MLSVENHRSMDFVIGLLIFTIIIGFILAYTNGFHDASNIVATMISSGAMSAKSAVILVGIFEFLGPVLGGTAVANTIGKLVDTEYIIHSINTPTCNVSIEEEADGTILWKVVNKAQEKHSFDNEEDFINYMKSYQAGYKKKKGASIVIFIVLVAMLGAITWNLITWYYGIPSSSSHALVGGLVGATLVMIKDVGAIKWGTDHINLLHPHGVLGVLIALLASPLLGFILGYVFQKITAFCLRRATPAANTWLKKLQWLSSAALAFSHGANDGQKSMGIIALLLFASGVNSEFYISLWVKILCASAITLGILSGGWRITKTIGSKIFPLRPIHGFSSQFSSATIILSHAFIGGPVSTTHVVSSTVMGVGTAERKKAVQWLKVKEILTTWIITVPASALISIIFYILLLPLAKFL